MKILPTHAKTDKIKTESKSHGALMRALMLCCVLGLMSALQGAAHADAFTWSGTTDSDWNTGTNWTKTAGGTSPRTFPNDPTDTATFPNTAALNKSPNISSSVTVNAITFSTLSYTISASAGQTLTTAAATSTVTTSSGSLSTISAPMAGPGFFKGGTGTLILSGTNTFTAGSTLAFTGPNTAVDDGAIRITSNGALGGITTINEGALGTGARNRLELIGGLSVGTGITIKTTGRNNQADVGAVLVSLSGDNTWNGNIAITSTGGGYGIRSDTAGNTLTLNGNLTCTTSGQTPRNYEFVGPGNHLVNGVISNSGGTVTVIGVTKSLAGTLTLTATNTYTGSTTINGGTLTLNNPTANAIRGGTITVNFGSLQLGASNQITDTVPVTLASGTFNTAGFSESTSSATTGLGTLTLAGTSNGTTDNSTSSTLDFSSGTSVLSFSAFGTGTGTLLVSNYTSGSDQFFVSGTGLTTAQLAQIRFVNPDGTGGQSGTFTAKQDATTGEVTPDFTTSITNTPPGNRYNGLITFPASVTTAEDTSLTLTGATALSVVDPDGTTLRVTLRPRNGRVKFNSTSASPNFVSGSSATSVVKIFTGTPSQINAVLSNITFIPIANFNSTDNPTSPASLTITSDDGGVNGGGATDTDVLTINVTAVNDAPVARADNAVLSSNATGTTLIVPVLANDSDVDSGQTLTVTATGGTPTQGTVAINSGTTITYTVTASTFSGSDTFTYTLSDGTATSTGTVTIRAAADATTPATTSVTLSGFTFSRSTRLYSQTATVTNTSSTTAINGPVYLVLSGLPSGVALANASGTTGGNPYILVSSGSLAANGTASVTLQFSDPSDTQISFSTSVLAGGTPPA